MKEKLGFLLTATLLVAFLTHVAPDGVILIVALAWVTINIVFSSPRRRPTSPTLAEFLAAQQRR